MLFGCIFFSTSIIFAYFNVNTVLGILPPPYQVVYTPAHITGLYTSGFVYVEITGDGIKHNSTGIWDNGTSTFDFYRGTGPFVTGAAYSNINIRTPLQTTRTIDRIDNTPPTFTGVTDSITYNSAVSITFADNLSGVTATINGTPFTYGGTISTDGTYQLVVTDAVGNQTGATFFLYTANITETGTVPQPIIIGGSGPIPLGAGLGAQNLIDGLCKQRSCYSSYYDSVCGKCAPPAHTIIPLPGVWPLYHFASPAPLDIKNSPYSQEQNNAYSRAYALGITTIPKIESGDIDQPLYRKFAAKMSSEFAMKAVGLTPNKKKPCIFNDIDKESPELQYYMKLSCQLGIMGLNYYGDPDKSFNPNYIVTRDQFVTILSRIIFRDEFNIKHGELTIYDQAKNFVVHSINNISSALGLPFHINTPLDRYTKHLDAIKKLGVITNYTLTTKEFRGYVMIIMYRIDQLGVSQIKNLIEKTSNALK